ncbi:UDP-glycosyltransferase [Thalassobellus citreus]|uniref:UDP-glycosyltransferase n=1 Tax=Thalassobellus citreus TaxID=3367752 RepID=UPI0037A22D36
MKNILVLVDSIDVDDSSGAKANVALILNLKKAGFNVTVYHYSYKNVEIEDLECFLINEIKWNLLYILSRSQRVFTRITGVSVHRLIENWLGFSFTYFNDVKSILKRLKGVKLEIDLVLTLSKGASFRTHYAVLKYPEFHNKWMAYVHDPYPFNCYPPPYEWIEPGHKHKERFFREVSKKAKYSAFPSLLLKEWMGNYFSNFLNTGIVIPHQNTNFDTSKAYPLPYFDSSKFNLLHAGNLMKQRSPEGLIEGFKLFLERNPNAKKNAKLSLIGNASYHEKALEEAQTEIAQIFVFKTNKSFLEIQFLQHKTAVNIILEAKSEISPFLPGKFPHCVNSNKPILLLGPVNSETKRLLGETYPYWAEIDAVDDIANNIKKLYTLWEENKETLQLNRPDLERYVSHGFLKEILTNLK